MTVKKPTYIHTLSVRHTTLSHPCTTSHPFIYPLFHTLPHTPTLSPHPPILEQVRLFGRIVGLPLKGSAPYSNNYSLIRPAWGYIATLMLTAAYCDNLTHHKVHFPYHYRTSYPEPSLTTYPLPATTVLLCCRSATVGCAKKICLARCLAMTLTTPPCSMTRQNKISIRQGGGQGLGILRSPLQQQVMGRW